MKHAYLIPSAVALFLCAAAPVAAQPRPVKQASAASKFDYDCEMVGLSAGGSIFQGSCSPHDPKILTVATDMGAAFITYDGGEKWHTIHFRQLANSHRASAAFHPKDPKTIYWVAGNDLRVSKDQGCTWASVSRKYPWMNKRARVIRIWLDPDYPARIFVGTETSTYLSKDEGKAWKECADAPGYLFRVVADRQSPAEKRVYCIGTNQGFFRSDDGGKTFVKKMQGLSGENLKGFAGGSNERSTILYASIACSLKDGKLAGGVFRSKDKGETWERCMNPRINRETRRNDEYALGDLPQYSWIACADKMPERAYVFCNGTSYYPPNHATLYRTDNAGGAWQDVLFTDPRFKECNVETDWQTELWGQREQGSLRGLEISASNPDVVVIDQERFLHATADGGKTWKSPYRGTFRTDARGKKHWATTGEVVTSTWNYYIDPFDKTRHYICYTDVCLARSLDGGKAWLPEAYNLKKMLPPLWTNTCYELAFDPDVKGRVWGAFSAMHDIPNDNAVYQGGRLKRRGGVAVSHDHGATWKKLRLPEAPVTSVVVDPKSPRDKRTLYASLFEKGVYRSTDGGQTWELKNSGLDPDGTKRCLKLTLHKDGTLFVATTGRQRKSPVGVGLWRSRDKGDTWTRITEGQRWDWIRDYTVHPDDSSTILLPTTRVDAGLHRTTDGGKNWATIFRSKTQSYFFGAAYHPTNKGWIYLTAGEGEDAQPYPMYLSKDDGKTWVPYTRIPFLAIQRVVFNPDDPKHILLTTFGSSVIKASIEP